MFRLNLTVNAVDEINALNAEGRFAYLEGAMPNDTYSQGADDDGRTVEFLSNDTQAVSLINAELNEAGSELQWMAA